VANMTIAALGGARERRAQDYGHAPGAAALIYRRWSSMAQIRHHAESTRSQ
jgi:hypothetical protein